MMLAPVTICSILLFCLLWTDESQAGASFLSPADLQKNTARRPPKKMGYSNVHRRAATDSWDNVLEQPPEDEREIGITFPLELNLKVTEGQYQRQKAALQEILSAFLSLSSDPAFPPQQIAPHPLQLHRIARW
ncbi:appetite-regulating hormone [Pelodytes ibericus]